ncbi:hypothetical protein [Halocatena marina]|uniref:hypothetical protein n=1 Tax=Halocatena marina TaxID=2934937 RepID=UPI00200CED18|nr:hypothetical protein [Halocatena marina]
MSGRLIWFQFESIDAETRFVREYLPNAWERFEASDFFETGWFWRYGQYIEYDAGPDGGIYINVEGDLDRLVEAEAPRWNAFEGLTDWTVNQPQADGDSLLAQQRDSKGEVAGEWDYRLKPLVTRFVLEYSQKFTEPLPLLTDDAPTSKDKVIDGYGYWVVIHYLMAQAGYDWYDETDACLTAMQNRVKSIAAYRGAEAARAEYERLLSEWKSHREDLEQWLEEAPTGEATVE